jgi:hypothetical protein
LDWSFLRYKGVPSSTFFGLFFILFFYDIHFY